MGVTHLLSISPAENTTSSFASVMNHHVSINSQSPEALLLVLPSICDYIRDSVKNNGLVLVHCQIESRACTAVCAYRKCFPLFLKPFFSICVLVMSGGCSCEQAFCVIQNGQYHILFKLSFLSPHRNSFSYKFYLSSIPQRFSFTISNASKLPYSWPHLLLITLIVSSTTRFFVHNGNNSQILLLQ